MLGFDAKAKKRWSRYIDLVIEDLLDKQQYKFSVRKIKRKSYNSKKQEHPDDAYISHDEQLIVINSEADDEGQEKGLLEELVHFYIDNLRIEKFKKEPERFLNLDRSNKEELGVSWLVSNLYNSGMRIKEKLRNHGIKLVYKNCKLVALI